MCIYYLSLVFFMFQFALAHAQWILIDQPRMPRTNSRMAIGAYNKSIYMMGGWSASKQLIVYNIENDSFIDLYGTFSIDYLYGSSVFYTQVDNLLYMSIRFDALNTRLNTFNLETEELIENVHTIPIPVNYLACLASVNDHIYVIRGLVLQVLDLNTAQWLSNISSLNVARSQHSCVIHPNTNVLYVIGGTADSFEELFSIESININNIAHNAWKHAADLIIALRHTRAVSHEDIIYILGGSGDGNGAHDFMQLMDAITTQVTLSPHRLSYGVYGMGAIVYNGTIYAFGGYAMKSNGHIGAVDTWMKYELNTTSDTSPLSTSPSVPSEEPSADPTAAPFEGVLNEIKSTESTETTDANEESQSKYDEKTVYIVTIVCLGAIILLYLLYKFKKEIATLLRAASENNTNMEAEIADDVEPENVNEIEPGRAENKAPDVNKARVKMTKRQGTLQRTVEGERDNDDIDERDDVEGLYVKNMKIETTTNDNTPNTTAGVTQTSRGKYDV